MTDATPSRWQPLLGGVLMNLALGVIYAWSVFVAPFGEDFGWNRTQVSVVFTIAILSVGSWFVVAGFLQDRYGPQRVAAFGGILYALGFYLASQTESLIWLYVTFGAIAGAGNGFAMPSRSRSARSGSRTVAASPSASSSAATAPAPASTARWRGRC